jgi:hypothetical protein
MTKKSIQKLDASGERPMSRSREWRRQHSSRERWQKKDRWYKKGGYESVIFIAATPILPLRDSMRERSGVWDLRSK